MERRQIRKRWQVTIPREIRRRLNLFQGQVLNWDLVSDTPEGFSYIRIYTGQYAEKLDELAFREALTRKVTKRRQQRCGAKIRKLDMHGTRERRLEAISLPRLTDVTEFQALISELSSYLLNLQGRLSSSPGESSE